MWRFTLASVSPGLGSIRKVQPSHFKQLLAKDTLLYQDPGSFCSFLIVFVIWQSKYNFRMFLQLSSSEMPWEMFFNGLCPQEAADVTPQSVIALTWIWAYKRPFDIAWEVWICYLFKCHGQRCLFCTKHFFHCCLSSLSAAVSSGQTKA